MGTKNFNIPLGTNPDLGYLSNELANLYRTKGYLVNVFPPVSPVNQVLEITKSGMIGMGMRERVSLTLMNGGLFVSLEDEEQTTRIVCMVIGWLLCLIPFITGIIGYSNHSDLQNSLERDIQMLAARQF